MAPIAFSLLLVLLSTIVLFMAIQYVLRIYNWKQIKFPHQGSLPPQNKQRGKHKI